MTEKNIKISIDHGENGLAVHVHKDHILVTARRWNSGELAFSVSQGGDPKSRMIDTIIGMIRIANDTIMKEEEQSR